MKIKLRNIKISDIFAGYSNNIETGEVKAYNGKLNIRPAYQREFVYSEDKQIAVVKSIMNNFPLNTMYWAENGDGTFEVIDGQQRTISFCEYMKNSYSVNEKYYHSLSEIERKKISDYEVSVYICEGDDKEKIDWFETINIAPEKLTDQELRNAVYSGPFTSDAREKFSKKNSLIARNWSNYLSGKAIRQDYLQTALKWISDHEGLTINEFMSKHQYDENADYLYNEFMNIMNWVKEKFEYRDIMKKVQWGNLYYLGGSKDLIKEVAEETIKELLIDEEVTDQRGIYEFVINNNKNALSLRKFDIHMKRTIYERQNKKCAICQKEFEFKEMQGDHITPWSKGGKTVIENCQMLCGDCNNNKSDD